MVIQNQLIIKERGRVTFSINHFQYLGCNKLNFPQHYTNTFGCDLELQARNQGSLLSEDQFRSGCRTFDRKQQDFASPHHYGVRCYFDCI